MHFSLNTIHRLIYPSYGAISKYLIVVLWDADIILNLQPFYHWRLTLTKIRPSSAFAFHQILLSSSKLKAGKNKNKSVEGRKLFFAAASEFKHFTFGNQTTGKYLKINLYCHDAAWNSW